MEQRRQSPDYVMSNREFDALKSVGYCNIGHGKIAKVQRQFGRALEQNAARCGVTPDWCRYTKEDIRREHIYRSMLAENIQISEQAAEQFPPSWETLTNTVLGTDENNEIVRLFVRRINNIKNVIPTDVCLESDFYRKRDYLADAIF